MEKDRAFELLSNLWERATSTTDRTFLTSREVEALGAYLGVVGDSAANEVHRSARVQAPVSLGSQGRVLRSLAIDKAEVQPDAMLCIDFGTSFSKAFLSLGDGIVQLELIDLSLGDGSTGSRLTTPSELFIDNGHIYFGTQARERLDATQASSDRLIDSIKQFITLNADVSTLSEVKMQPAQDPSQRFSQRDILILYLAHLMALTESALSSKGISNNVLRRFTHPAWKTENKDRNQNHMRRMMAEAVLLARSSPAEFSGRIPISDARTLLDQLAGFDENQIPVSLIHEPVREATAAGAGALLATREGGRETYLVVDIGAGTTDVAAFICVNNPERDRPRVSEIALAADALPIAGNMLDNALQKYVLERSGLVNGTEEYRAAGHAIRRTVRQYKELLFSSKQAIVELPTENVTVLLDEFQAYAPVVAINKALSNMIAKSAAVAAGSANRVNLVATGGGYSLPIIGELAQNGADFDGRHVSLVLREAIAPGVRESNPDLVDPYPQIAVALGGSLPTLPQPITSVAGGLTETPSLSLLPNYRS